MSTWLRPLREHWISALCRHLGHSAAPMVRIVVAGVRGSSPRDPGASMLICDTETLGTIGGGNLEWQAVGAARALLAADGSLPSVRVRNLVLGRELGQCCGGVVQLWLERFTPADLPLLQRAATEISSGTPSVITTELSQGRVTRRLERRGANLREATLHAGICFSSMQEDTVMLSERIQLVDPAAVWLYGAGHVGQALIRVLADLPFQITWIDPRPELLPDSLPDNVRVVSTDSPVEEVSTAPPTARHIVMTHDHALDYAICRAVLARDDYLWLGLIGSKSKAARFRSRLLREGVASRSIQRLVCPIGVPGVSSKWPTAIAVAIAAQLLQDAGATMSTHVDPTGDACSPRDCSECAANRGIHS
jgi:xanthine dehydrogenase accessory factor